MQNSKKLYRENLLLCYRTDFDVIDIEISKKVKP